MANRGAAAALACHAPGCESFAAAAPLLKRRRGDPERKEEPRGGGGGGGLKRQRAEEGEEAEAAARAAKRGRGATALSRQQRPQGCGSARGGRPKAPLEEHEDDVWRYNSFQYWRSPLPAIDLSDILDLEKDDTIDARQSSSVCLSEMET